MEDIVGGVVFGNGNVNRPDGVYMDKASGTWDLLCEDGRRRAVPFRHPQRSTHGRHPPRSAHAVMSGSQTRRNGSVVSSP